MTHSKLAWNLLDRAVGSYQGKGVNHEGQPFTGRFKIANALRDKLFSIESSAVSDGGEVYHAETSFIGHDISGTLMLWVASTNHPGVTPHVFDRIVESPECKNVVFRFGEMGDRNSFREEITISVYSDGSVAHHYSWGLPGGDFEPRSGSRMQRIS